VARESDGLDAVRAAMVDSSVARYELRLGDGIAFMAARRKGSIEAIVTDPPYGVREYEPAEQAKLRRGRGGVWRIPPALDGHVRGPLPRFTVLTDADRVRLARFFEAFAQAALHVLAPGGHLILATQPLLSHLVYAPLVGAGFEKRGEIVRLVQTLRGGDRPKNAEREFAGVSVMPRSAWEPWGVFRKPCEGRVQDNLRRYKTGGLRRTEDDRPFADVIRSAPTRSSERDLAPHPSLKPQSFMRQLVRAALPLGEGRVLDPFMGGGSTIAAAVAVGYPSIGVELDPSYFAVAKRAIPKLSNLAR
jgi:tRNA G10  N-methylase Trm11